MTKAQENQAKQLEQFTAEVKNKMGENADRVAKGVADYTAFAKETASAFAQSAGVAGKAVEAINAETLALASQTVREGVAVAKEAGAAKNFADVVEIQAAYATKTYGELTAKSAAINDVMRGAMENAIDCVSGRIVAFADLARTQRV